MFRGLLGLALLRGLSFRRLHYLISSTFVKNTYKIFGLVWLACALLLTMTAGLAMAQNNSRTPVWKEDHEADAAKWFQHFVNPMNEANYESLRQVGFEQMHQMDTRPAMKALSSASWQV